ncbi:MAG TPA: phosphatase PAP2 family protein [Sphingomicrobium sp.]|nr:phosphatase PAP2 family protein [Sphingomicrobium sp.]
MPISKILIGGIAILGAAGLALNGYIKLPGQQEPASAADKFAAHRLGYLPLSALPDAKALLPPPPAADSAAMAVDERARKAALPLRGTPRYALAAADAVRAPENTARAFQCAFGMEISRERTPKLYELLSRVRLDARAATYSAKGHFRRPRPFAVHQARSCYPPDDQMVHDDGSYPSARAAVGWAYALVLAGLRPDRRDIILQRGRDFGQSRVVCDLEWQSDVDAGRTIATVTVGRMEANEAFRTDREIARREVAAAGAAGAKPPAECNSERAILASR